MSKKGLLITFAFACVVTILFIGKLSRNKSTVGTAPVLQNSSGQQASPMSSAPPSPAPPLATTPLSFEDRKRHFVDAFKTPISFYGKVIDQHGTPISQADVKLAANDDPFGSHPSNYALKTDENGLFSIEGIQGLSLAVEVSKPGYQVIPRNAGTAVTSSGLFEFSVSPSAVRGRHIPNKNMPTSFSLYKPGPQENLVKVGEKSFRIARNGTPLRISLDSSNSPTHEIVLRCWNKDLARSPDQRQYDWRLEVSVEGGGLVRRNNSFAFEAPNDGYVPSDIIDMPASLPQNEWHGSADRSYFIRFNNGIFARARLEIRAGGDHFVVWESYLNLTPGDRNLEFDPNERVSATPKN